MDLGVRDSFCFWVLFGRDILYFFQLPSDIFVNTDRVNAAIFRLQLILTASTPDHDLEVIVWTGMLRPRIVGSFFPHKKTRGE